MCKLFDPLAATRASWQLRVVVPSDQPQLVGALGAAQCMGVFTEQSAPKGGSFGVDWPANVIGPMGLHGLDRIAPASACPSAAQQTHQSRTYNGPKQLMEAGRQCSTASILEVSFDPKCNLEFDVLCFCAFCPCFSFSLPPPTTPKQAKVESI